ncbi:MAG: 4Fe-4S binding protein [Bacteroidetes bacterium]|nr:4Fe-4S binding protein [Bacteroidota bacterium]
MKKLFSYNFLSRIIFLLLTPVFFQYFALGFVWHSIYWGVITTVVLIWGMFILISPIFGRIGCGWFCFMGATSDLSSQHSLIKIKWRKPKVWTRLLLLIPFFASAITFYFINKERGITNNFAILPSFLKADFNIHYKYVWVIDITCSLLFGLLLERRWACKNLCVMGALCSVGAKYSRLITVVDTNKCTLCGQCEKNCLVRIPITDYIKNNQGLVTNSECILCGKCIESCKFDAIKLKFVWNRKKYKQSIIERDKEFEVIN